MSEVLDQTDLDAIFDRPLGRMGSLIEKEMIWQELKEGYENIERIFGAVGGCRCCGNCCRHIPAEITPVEIARIARHLKRGVNEVLNEFARWHHERIFLKTPCPFITENNKCSIHSARPVLCKFFPIKSTLAGFTVAKNPSCPLSQKIFRNLEEYANSPEVKRESEGIPLEEKSFVESHVKAIIEEGEDTERVPQEADKTIAKILFATPYTLKTFADWLEKKSKNKF